MLNKNLNLAIKIHAQDNTAAGFSKTRAGVESISEQLATAKEQAIAFMVSMAGLSQVQALARIVDEVSQVNARLRQATGSVQAFAAAQKQALALSAETGAGYAAVAALYGRLSLTAQDYGLSQERMAAVTEITARALRVSGASAAESASVITQLSQALGSGVLRGEEFNAIMESGGRLAKALADGLGLPIGQLRQLAEQGLLTTEIVTEALESQREVIARESAAMPETIGASLVAVRDAFGQTAARMNEATGASSAVSGAFQGLARHMEAIANTGAGLAVLALSVGIGRLAAATQGATASTIAKIAVERQATATAIAHTQARVSYAAAELAAAQASVAAAAGMARLAVVQNTLIPAQQRLTAAQLALNAAHAQGAVVTRGLGAALSFVGGPLGLILGLLTAGATAWMIWGNRAETAADRANNAIDRARDALRRLNKEQTFGVGDAGALREGIAALEERVNVLAMTRGSAGAAEMLKKARVELAAMNAQLKAVEARDAAPGAPTEAGQKLMRKQWAAYIAQFRDKGEQLQAAVADLRQKAQAAGVAETAPEFQKALAGLQARFATRRAAAARRSSALSEPAFDAELAALQAHLKTTEGVLETAFRARLIDEETYHRAKAEAQRRAIDLEERELRGRLADQPEQLRVALEALAGKRYVVDFELRTNLDRARQDFADFKVSLEREIAQATGTETPEMRREAIRAEFADMIARFGDDADGAALVERVINVKAAQRELQALEAAWRMALETMRNTEQSINIQREQGLITSAEAQGRITEAHRQAAAVMDELLPKLEAAAVALGPEAAARVLAWKNELAGVKSVTDPLAASLNTSIKSAFENMFLAIGQGAKTAKEAFADFARSVLAAIQRILAQKLAEKLFGAMGAGSGTGGGLGAFIGKILGFATGGPVPGTGNRDTVPALLTPGEFVIRKDAVRRFGAGFLAAINGLSLPPPVIGGRMAFAAGGLVPAAAAAPAAPLALSIVNAIDPGVTHDHLNTPAGERAIVNVIRRNAGAIRQFF